MWMQVRVQWPCAFQSGNQNGCRKRWFSYLLDPSLCVGNGSARNRNGQTAVPSCGSMPLMSLAPWFAGLVGWLAEAAIAHRSWVVSLTDLSVRWHERQNMCFHEEEAHSLRKDNDEVFALQEMKIHKWNSRGYGECWGGVPQKFCEGSGFFQSLAPDSPPLFCPPGDHSCHLWTQSFPGYSGLLSSQVVEQCLACAKILHTVASSSTGWRGSVALSVHRE